jgi:hypothetical protein
MYTNYPNKIDTNTQLPAIVDKVTPVIAETVNRVREAVLAIEKELGVQPSGIYDTVKARLDAIEIILNEIILIGGIVGPPGPAGIPGPAPSANILSNFIQPAVNSYVDVTVDDTIWMGINGVLYIDNSGYYTLTNINTLTNVIRLTNLGYPNNAVSGSVIAAGSKIVTAGVIGATGPAGAAGAAPYANTLMDFTQPAIDTDTMVIVDITSWMALNEYVYVENAGYYKITDINNTYNTIRLYNLGYNENVSVGTNIVANTKIVPSGHTGPAGPLYNNSKLLMVYPYSKLNTTSLQNYVSAALFQFDPTTLIPSTGISSIVLQVITESSGPIVNIQLYNVTTSSVVGSSNLSTSSLTPTTLTTGDIKSFLTNGMATYEIQMKMGVGGLFDLISLDYAVLKVTWT